MPTRCNRGFYCRSYCLLNMFRTPLCPSSGAQEYFIVVAVCGISCCGVQVAGLVWSWGLYVRLAGCWFTGSVEQAIRSAIKASVASSWHFISTYVVYILKSVRKGTGKVIPLQVWSGPESPRKLRFPDFTTTTQGGGKVFSLTHRPPLLPENTPGTHVR